VECIETESSVLNEMLERCSILSSPNFNMVFRRYSKDGNLEKDFELHNQMV